mgnify:CR=1 FL=1
MAEGSLNGFKGEIVRFRLQDVPEPVVVCYVKRTGLAAVWIKALGRHDAEVELSGAGFTEIEAATNAVRQLLGEADGNQLKVYRAEPKREKRSGVSVVQSAISYDVGAEYREEFGQGTGAHRLATQAYIMALFTAINKIHVKLANREMVPVRTA